MGVVNYLNGNFPNEQDHKPLSDDFEVCFGDGISPGDITVKLYNLLLGLQNGDLDDEEVIKQFSSWIHVVDP